MNRLMSYSVDEMRYLNKEAATGANEAQDRLQVLAKECNVDIS